MVRKKKTVENENELKQGSRGMSDEDFREIFDASEDALFVHEISTGKILNASRKTGELFGYSRDEFLGLNVSDISSDEPPYDQEHASNYINAAARVGPQCFEWMCKRRSGDLFWAEVTLKQVSLGGCQRVLAAVRDISARKKAEEHAKLLSSMVEQSSEGVALVDFNADIVYINKAFARMHGYDPVELIGENISIFHNDEQMEFVKETNDEIRDSGMFRGEVWHVRRDGTPFPALMHNTILKDEKGEPVGMIGMARDISEQKCMEKELQDEKLLLKEYVNALSGLFYVFDEHRFIMWNSEMNRVTGYSDEELANMYGADFCEGEDRVLIVERMRSVFLEGSADIEVDLVTKDGRHIPYYLTAQRKRLGGVDYLVGLGIDITDLKRVEEELRYSEERYRSLVDLSPDAIIVHLMGKIVYVNRAGVQLFRFDSMDDVIGRELLDFVHPDYRDIVRERVAKTYEGDWAGERIEERMICADGEILDVEVAVGPIAYKGERAAQVVIRDITKRKQDEEKLRIYSGGLEKMVDERTRELDHARAKLFHSSKLTAVGRLGASVAHQLNSPICGGLLFVDALLNDFKNTEKQKRTLEILKKSLIGMRDVIDCTLSMAMVSRDGRPANDYVDLNESLSRVMDMSSLECKRRSIRVMKTLDPEISKIPAVVGELDQIFINIIHNAIDAMPDGGDLLIASENVPDGILITIEDTGRGMPREQLSQIFEPFFTTRMAERGIGLGLAIALDIAEKYGGEIDAESEMGKGTIFYIRLPLKCDLKAVSAGDSQNIG